MAPQRSSSGDLVNIGRTSSQEEVVLRKIPEHTPNKRYPSDRSSSASSISPSTPSPAPKRGRSSSSRNPSDQRERVSTTKLSPSPQKPSTSPKRGRPTSSVSTQPILKKTRIQEPKAKKPPKKPLLKEIELKRSLNLPTIELQIPHPEFVQKSFILYIGKPIYLKLFKHQSTPPLFTLQSDNESVLMNISFNPYSFSLYNFLNTHIHKNDIETIYFISRNETDKVILILLKNKETHIFSNTFNFNKQPRMKAIFRQETN